MSMLAVMEVISEVRETIDSFFSVIWDAKSLVAFGLFLLPLVLGIDNDYVFTWEDGHPYSPDYVSHTFHKLLKKYDLPHIRFHDLRHTCASMLLSEGYGLKDVQEWLGHSDIKMTANIYGHLDIRRKRSIANGLEQALPRLKP